MNIDDKMRIALEIGKKSLEQGELPVGAVIFKGDEIIGRAYSSGESKQQFLRHAEMKVLWEVDEQGYSVRDRKNMQLFVTLEPCMMCLGAAMGAFIGEIYYSVPSPIDGAVALAESSLNSNNVEIPSYTLPKCFGGVLQEEGKELLKRYVEIKEEGALVNFCKKLISL
ncbi:nucleoside deaminase [Clostridium cellulovorans]|uniref:CMP/dCMP deaminase zinc-binding n=1 Tax=Clostridium cellulovorans (strain ATCC 35296 / DSM 3052 / OCM 3 / 743B) TaxID=573061 RepID=D9SNS2_CLOC7|nr:nucleoside deaminase [Clostridium cellulovorans]ADL49943.1 CMP/dCMP deaminase zinc-binding [Clostridium cellulovorans 743B]